MVQNKKHSKILGVDLDPANDMDIKPQPDGDVKVRYRNGTMTYDECLDEMEERATNHSQGKPIKKGSIGYFSGFGEGTLKKNN